MVNGVVNLTGWQVNKLTPSPGSSYDKNKNLTEIKATYLPSLNRTYSYDALNRLEYAKGPFGEYTYEYDLTGNRMSATKNDQVDVYSKTPGTNMLDQVVTPTEAIDYGYDNNGNITDKGDLTFVYNQNSRLTRVEQAAIVLGEYSYNGLEQRVSKTVDSETTLYLYDFDGRIIAETDASGTLLTEYIYNGTSLTAKVDTSGYVYMYILDRLGTPTALQDTNGDTVWQAAYDPFGEVTVNSESTIENNIRFPGQYFDSETGLHYNWHRYYNPKTGRYLTPDPIGLAGGINPFVYAGANPINWIDPKGLLVEIHSRQVQGISFGTHTYTTITPNGGNPVTYGSYNVNGMNVVERNNVTDHGPNRLPRTSTITIPPPVGMTQDQWDSAVMQAAENRRLNQVQGYAPLSQGDSVTSGNCNTTTRGIFEDVGGIVPENYNPPGYNPGLHRASEELGY